MNGIDKIIEQLPKILIDSFKVAFAILGGVGVVISFTSFKLELIGKLPAQIGVVTAFYSFLVIGTLFIKYRRSRNEVSLNIRGMKVIIKEGDIFTAKGWKLIPFNEYFDTQVDDIIIAHSSLNGKFIDSLSDDGREALKQAIATDNKSPLQKYTSSDSTRTKYDLGTIKVFQDVMMLALSHFNEQNEAHTNRAEYEHWIVNSFLDNFFKGVHPVLDWRKIAK